jgi:hypothetical protein
MGTAKEWRDVNIEPVDLMFDEAELDGVMLGGVEFEAGGVGTPPVVVELGTNEEPPVGGGFGVVEVCSIILKNNSCEGDDRSYETHETHTHAILNRGGLCPYILYYIERAAAMIDCMRHALTPY